MAEPRNRGWRDSADCGGDRACWTQQSSEEAMPRRTRTAIAAIALLVSLGTLSACGGRPDSGNPGNPSADTTTSGVDPVGEG
jgi:hypothetical protein